MNDMALSPEPKTPAGLAGGKKMVMVAGRRKMKYWETWFLTFGAGCMVGAVMTNQYFTAPAVEAAKKLHILLWDRGYVDGILEEE